MLYWDIPYLIYELHLTKKDLKNLKTNICAGDCGHITTTNDQHHAQQGSASTPYACPTTVTTNVAVPVSFSNQNITANQLVQAVYVNNQVYGKY